MVNLIGVCNNCKRAVEIPSLSKIGIAKCIVCHNILNIGAQGDVECTTGTTQYYEDENAVWFKVNNISQQSQALIERGWVGVAEYLQEALTWKKKSLAIYYNIPFWIKKIVWKMPIHAKGYIQFTIRPYTQGYGCDGTTDSNIHLIAMTWAERNGYSYLEKYKEAYGTREFFKESEIETWFNYIKEMHKKFHETIIPDKIDAQLMIDDLEAINNRSLATVIENIIKS
jgi:hypothetical protein